MPIDNAAKRVLVVDDEKIVQTVMKALLEGIGCFVVVANNGVEALAILQNEKFDLVLSDINMPQMDGYELAKSIRNSTGISHDIPIFGISACSKEEGLQKAKGVGMNDLFQKPISVDLLKKLVQ
jgi:two-component system capsular synthesis sensor histidine kinase RcsC